MLIFPFPLLKPKIKNLGICKIRFDWGCYFVYWLVRKCKESLLRHLYWVYDGMKMKHLLVSAFLAEH